MVRLWPESANTQVRLIEVELTVLKTACDWFAASFRAGALIVALPSASRS